MSYFEVTTISFMVQKLSDSGVAYMEYELSVDELFNEFIIDMMTELANRKICNQGEFFDYYVLPHYDDLYIQGKENIKIEKLSNSSDILISKEPEIGVTTALLTKQPIKYLEIILKSSPARLTYSRHFSLDEIKPIVDKVISLTSQLPKEYKGKIANPFVLIAKHNLNRDLSSNPTVIIYSHDHLNNTNVAIESSPEDLEAIDIDIHHETIAESKSLSEFANKININKDIKNVVLISKKVFNNLLDQSSGVFGMLVGTVYTNADQEGLIIEIKEMIRVGNYSYGISLKHNDLADSLETIETRFPDYKILGWYRSSTDFDMGIRKTDQFAHQTLFPDEWQCFLLIRPDISNISCFVSKGGSLVYTSNVYIWDQK